jgi:hypothetical protein
MSRELQVIGDRFDAWDAFEEVLERFIPRLGMLSPEDAEAWSRAIVEEHACDGRSEHRFELYDSLLDAARVARERNRTR